MSDINNETYVSAGSVSLYYSRAIDSPSGATVSVFEMGLEDNGVPIGSVTVSLQFDDTAEVDLDFCEQYETKQIGNILLLVADTVFCSEHVSKIKVRCNPKCLGLLKREFFTVSRDDVLFSFEDSQMILEKNKPDASLIPFEYYQKSEIDKITVNLFDDSNLKEWDSFISNSVNGTFLDSRAFLNYHPPGRFTDYSLLIRRKSELIAIVPACVIEDESGKVFFSHRGTTFGGIITNEQNYNISSMKLILHSIEKYLGRNGFRSAVFKPTAEIFCTKAMGLTDYLFFKYHYDSYVELSFFIDCSRLPEDVVESFTRHKRKHYKESLRSNLLFRKFTSDKEIGEFHAILRNNLKLHNREPTHTLEELLDLYRNRVGERMCFYGVFRDERMIAGTMLFIFSEKVIHTQYIASDYNYSDTYCTYFLYGELIKLVKRQGYETLSFGISTENNGQYLNEGLASLKEGFGSSYSVNKTYYRRLA